MIVKAFLFLIYVLSQTNVQCSNLVQIDKLHFITPKLTMSNDRRLQFDQQPSFSSINYRTVGEERPSNSDQVASIQYELKIVQQKPLSTFSSSTSTVASDESTDENKVTSSSKSIRNNKKEKKINLKDSSKVNENEENSEDKQQTKLSQASSILQHYPHLIQKQSKHQQQLNENHSLLIHHSYPQNAFSSYSQPIKHDLSEQHSMPEVKKIVHIHHYHHEHIGGDGISKVQEKEQEKRTEKLVEKQVQQMVLKNFERELEKEQRRGMKKRRKKKGIIKKFSPLEEEEEWKPVKYSELLSKSNRKKSHVERPNFDYEDNFKAYSHDHDYKVLRKKPKEMKNNYEDDEHQVKYKNRRKKNGRSHKEESHYRERDKNEDAEKDSELNEYVDDQNEEKFLKRPLTNDEENYYKKNLESSDDYAFENDEHYLPNDSNRLVIKRSKLNDEDSKEIKKSNGKKRKSKDNEDTVKNERTYKERIYSDKSINDKIYNDRPHHDKSFQAKLYQDQSTDRPETILDLIRANQKLRKSNFEDQQQEPLIELLNTNMSKQNSLRRNWLGLELITKNS